MSALRRLLAATIVAASGKGDVSTVDAFDRWLGCVAARGHSFDVDGKCSKCGAPSHGGKSIMDLAASARQHAEELEARIRREGN